jgi:hypothetical protein
MNTTLTRLTRNAAAAALLLVFGAGAACAADAPPATWQFNVTPYAWLTDTGIDLKIKNRQVVDTTIPVSDLLEDLDTIVQFRAEAQHGMFGVAVDLFDATFSDQASGIALPQGAGTASVDASFGMTILDVAGMVDVTGGRQGFVVLAGTRVIDERTTIDGRFEPTSGPASGQTFDAGDTKVDGLIGLRMRRRIAGRFSLATQSDVSTGGTDLTWSVSPTLNYHFGPRGRTSLMAGYRRMGFDFKDENGVESKMTLSGFLAGVRVGL